MLFLRAADEAHRGHAVAVAVERLLGGLAQFRVVGKAEIVVGAEIQHLCPPATSISAACFEVITRSDL